MEQVWTFLGEAEAHGAGLEWETHWLPGLCLLFFGPLRPSRPPPHTPKHSRAGVNPSPPGLPGEGLHAFLGVGPLGWGRVGDCHCVGTSKKALFLKDGAAGALRGPLATLSLLKDNRGG